jgi:hypothetical protein
MTLQNKRNIAIIALLSAGFLAFYGWLLPRFDVSIPDKKLLSLDLLPRYSLTDINSLFTSIGHKGIQQYYSFLAVDYLYIPIYCLLTFFILKYLLNNSGRLGEKISFIRWFPFFVGLIDCIENINTFVFLKMFPGISVSHARFGSFVSTSKWYAASVLAGAIICLLFYFVLRNLFWKLKTH